MGRKIIILFCFFVLTGCNDSPSSNHETSAIRAIIAAESRDGISVDIEMFMKREDSFGTYIKLDEEDRLFVVNDDDYVEMNEDVERLFNTVSYKANLPYSREEYVVNFDRYDIAKNDAPYSHFYVPEPFQIKSDVISGIYNDNDAVNLEWEAFTAGEEESFGIVSLPECTLSDGETYRVQNGHWIALDSEDGISTLMVKDFLAMIDLYLETTDKDQYGNDIEIEDCVIALVFERNRKGILDSEWDGGSINASQKREVEIEYIAE